MKKEKMENIFTWRSSALEEADKRELERKISGIFTDVPEPPYAKFTEDKLNFAYKIVEGMHAIYMPMLGNLIIPPKDIITIKAKLSVLAEIIEKKTNIQTKYIVNADGTFVADAAIYVLNRISDEFQEICTWVKTEG